jgi:hypothetical protein
VDAVSTIDVHIQLWRLQGAQPLRIRLDGKVIGDEADGMRESEKPTSDSSPSPKTLGHWQLSADAGHLLVVDAPGRFSTRLEWRPTESTEWVVVSYYENSEPSADGPQITFSLQDHPAAGK